MAKASDLIGRSGSGGFQPQNPKTVIQPPDKKEEGADHSATRKKPNMDTKPPKGGRGPTSGGGGAPTSVRPKV